MSLGIIFQPVDATTARHLPALASLMLDEANEAGDETIEVTVQARLRAVSYLLISTADFFGDLIIGDLEIEADADAEYIREQECEHARYAALIDQANALAATLSGLADQLDRRVRAEWAQADRVIAEALRFMERPAS